MPPRPLAHRALLTSLALAMPVACTAGLSELDKASLQDAAKLDAYAYERATDGGARALVRGAYCATAGVLRRAEAGVPEGGITCSP